jgi:hypothetical protein
MRWCSRSHEKFRLKYGQQRQGQKDYIIVTENIHPYKIPPLTHTHTHKARRVCRTVSQLSNVPFLVTHRLKIRRNLDPTSAFASRFLLDLLSNSISGHINHGCLKQEAIKKSTDASLTRERLYLQTYLCITSRHINYWLVAPYTK